MLRVEAEVGKVMVAVADRPYADGGGRGGEVNGGRMLVAEAGKVMVAKADRPYADDVGQGGEVDGG